MVCGFSMGGLQTYQWASLYPSVVHSIVPFCGSAKCSPHNFVFLEGVKSTLSANIGAEGLKSFGRVYCGWAFSQDWFREEKFKELGFADSEELLKFWEEDHLAWNPYDLLCMLKTWQTADISKNSIYNADFLQKAFSDALKLGEASIASIPVSLSLSPSSRERVVVTGAAGGIGKRVVNLLLQEGTYDVIGTDRVEYKESPTPFVVVDLSDPSAVASLYKDVHCVIHIAAIAGPANTTPAGCSQNFSQLAQIQLENLDPAVIFDNNVKSTFNVFDQATKMGLRRVVFSSSAFTMGWSHDPNAFVPLYLPLDEDHPMTPFETYGLSKQVGETIAQMMSRSSETSFVSLRFTNVVHPDKVKDLPWPAPSNSNPATPVMWAYTAVEDAALSHLLALKAPIVGHEAFLVAAPTTRFKEPTMDLINNHFGAKVPIKYKIEGNASIICCNKAKRMLGLNPKSLF